MLKSRRRSGWCEFQAATYFSENSCANAGVTGCRVLIVAMRSPFDPWVELLCD